MAKVILNSEFIENNPRIVAEIKEAKARNKFMCENPPQKWPANYLVQTQQLEARVGNELLFWIEVMG